jgi:hypothetical protein
MSPPPWTGSAPAACSEPLPGGPGRSGPFTSRPHPAAPLAAAPSRPTARPAAPTTFRLLLAIGTTDYRVRPITSALHSRAFRLRRADGKGEYFVTQGEDGHACDCGDFTWRREGTATVCKHVRALRAARLLDPAPTP